MIIKTIIIQFERTPNESSEETPENKQITYENKNWSCTHPLWNRDIQLMNTLRELIKMYNERR